MKRQGRAADRDLVTHCAFGARTRSRFSVSRLIALTSVAIVWILASHAGSAIAIANWGPKATVRVELKAWIPFDHVVDPTDPFTTPFNSPVLHAPTCFHLPIGTRGKKRKMYRGDGHIAYPGGFRLLRWVTFTVRSYGPDRTPQYLSDVKSEGEISATHLDEVWIYDGRERACPIEVKTATKGGAMTENGAGFITLALDSSNPLALFAPAINAEVEIGVNFNAADPTSISNAYLIGLKYRTDQFPSYGLKVEINGQTYAQLVISDASCLSPTIGPAGALKLGRGLSSESNSGLIVVNADHAVEFLRDTGGFSRISPDARAEDGLCTGHDLSTF
jgi:hypothetical protein